MVHGGPYPSTSDGRSTSVGTRAIFRFTRPVCYQGFPNQALPEELKDENPLGIWRMVDGEMTRGGGGAFIVHSWLSQIDSRSPCGYFLDHFELAGSVPDYALERKRLVPP